MPVLPLRLFVDRALQDMQYPLSLRLAVKIVDAGYTWDDWQAARSDLERKELLSDPLYIAVQNHMRDILVTGIVKITPRLLELARAM